MGYKFFSYVIKWWYVDLIFATESSVHYRRSPWLGQVSMRLQIFCNTRYTIKLYQFWFNNLFKNHHPLSCEELAIFFEKSCLNPPYILDKITQPFYTAPTTRLCQCLFHPGIEVPAVSFIFPLMCKWLGLALIFMCESMKYKFWCLLFNRRNRKVCL